MIVALIVALGLSGGIICWSGMIKDNGKWIACGVALIIASCALAAETGIAHNRRETARFMASCQTQEPYYKCVAMAKHAGLE